MEFFDKFGVKWVGLAYYLVTFAVVLYLLRWLFWGRILEVIQTRQERIDRALADAEEARHALDANKEKADAVIHEATLQAQEIVRRAERTAADIEEQARQEARTAADLMVTRARVEIDRERAAAVADIRSQVVDLAVSAAGRVIEANLDADRNRKLVEEAINTAELRA